MTVGASAGGQWEASGGGDGQSPKRRRAAWCSRAALSAADRLDQMTGGPPRVPLSPRWPTTPVATTQNAGSRSKLAAHGHAARPAACAAFAGSGQLWGWSVDTGKVLELRVLSDSRIHSCESVMMRLIAVSIRSVKRFFGEICKDAWCLVFRRNGRAAVAFCDRGEQARVGRW
jgi:hypothetical protein